MGWGPPGTAAAAAHGGRRGPGGTPPGGAMRLQTPALDLFLAMSARERFRVRMAFG